MTSIGAKNRKPKVLFIPGPGGMNWPDDDDSSDSDYSPGCSDYVVEKSEVVSTENNSLVMKIKRTNMLKPARSERDRSKTKQDRAVNNVRKKSGFRKEDKQSPKSKKRKLKVTFYDESGPSKDAETSLDDGVPNNVVNNVSKKEKTSRKEQKKLPAGKSKKKKLKVTFQDESGPRRVDETSPEDMFQLPNEVLLKIFKYVVDSAGAIPFLLAAAEVSDVWNTVASEPRLWRCVDLSNVEHKSDKVLTELLAENLSNIHELILNGWDKALTMSLINVIASECTALTSIGLSGCRNINYAAVKVLVDSCPNLTSIGLSGCLHINYNAVVAITDSCPNLKTIDLSALRTNTNSQDSPVSNNAIKYLVSKVGDKLTYINISGNVISAFQNVLSTIAESCPKLEVLDASNITRSAQSRDVFYIPMEKLQNGCKELRVLRLANTPFTLANTSPSEQVDSPGFPELRELSIGQMHCAASYLSDDSLQRILKQSEKLCLLDVRGWSRITGSSLVYIPAWNLEHLFLSRCESALDYVLELLVKKWQKSLLEVDFSWNPQNTIDLAVKAFASESNDCPLNNLQLSGTKVTLPSIKMVLDNCKNLRYLDLTSCRSLPRGMKRLYCDESLVKLKRDISCEKFNTSD